MRKRKDREADRQQKARDRTAQRKMKDRESDRRTMLIARRLCEENARRRRTGMMGLAAQRYQEQLDSENA